MPITYQGVYMAINDGDEGKTYELRCCREAEDNDGQRAGIFTPGPMFLKIIID